LRLATLDDRVINRKLARFATTASNNNMGLLKSVGFRFCRPLQELEKAAHVLQYFLDELYRLQAWLPDHH
jgi:hypothetical protein